ncbi:homeobox-like protein HDP1 [Bicyclus anynana]|uniref:Homeobox-like protein HDP1 n=1 Tax=Bicyclus anynana TaxID=110368 RepID=A0A6J1P1H0_BICAN|nr:homeobox-like protein HDP1 [Bicyclus anynana]XP_023949975.2 homeobox-like protein HDP1 [Bicyclus anynana]
MAQVEPMDVDSLASDFDDKENSLQNSNVLKSPSTEKGYEELDATEYSIKLRYSITPTNSPMSMSYTARSDSGPNSLNSNVDNLTRSLNSTITKTDVLKTPKLPLQALSTSLYTNDKSCDKEGDITVTISGTNNDDNLSLPSTSSSAVQTPEATTPTKEIPKEEGSPIMRGLKSVFNMFRSSHSPIPPSDEDMNHKNVFNETLENNEELSISKLPDCTPTKDGQLNSVLASTPISNSLIKESRDKSKRSSPLKDSVVFNDDLERQLQWQDETEVFFKNEKIPIHLLFPAGQSNVDANLKLSVQNNNINNLNTTVEYMEVSNADVSDKSVNENKIKNDFENKTANNEMSVVESDNEFLDCETTYTQNRSYILETVQECSKPTPVVFRTDNIPHETCLEDYIEPIKLNNKEITQSPLPFEELNKTLPVELEIDSLPSEDALSSALDSLPGSSTIEPTSDSLPPLADSNSNLCKEDRTNDTVSQLNIKEINNIDDINNGNIIKSASANNILLESEKVNETMPEVIEINFDNDDKSTAITKKSQPQIQQSVDVNKTLQINMNNYDIDLEFENKSPNDYKDELFSDIETNSNNLPINDMIMKANENFDTDDGNTTRLLFNIDSILLHQVNSNCDTDFISNYTENTTEYLHSNVLDTSENHSISETKGFDDTVVIAVNEAIDNMTKSTKIIESVNREVADKNVSPAINNTVNTTNINEILVTEDQLSQNIVVNNNSDFESNLHENFDSTISFDIKHKISENVCSLDVNTVEDVKTVEINPLSLLNNCNSLCNEYSQDITMDSLEPNVNIINDQSPFEINKTDINAEIDNNYCCASETKEDLHTVPLPLDIPLPCDDNNVKEEHYESLNCTEAAEQTIILDSPQIQHEFVPNISFNEEQDKMQMQCDIDIIDKCSTIIPEMCDPLSTNLTTSSKELNMNTESKQINDKLNTITNSENNTQCDLNVDIRPKASSLPDVVNIINNAEGTDLFTTHQIKTDIVTDTLCFEDNVTSNVIDEEIVLSANNSPYVSVTELNLNLTSNVVIEENNSPPISPKCTSKGYNINFDDIEDPFATKTNIRMSPTLEDGLSKPFTPVKIKQMNETNLQRKQQSKQPERNKSDFNKKRFNKSIDRMKIINNSKTKSNIEKVHGDQIKEGQMENVQDKNSTSIKNDILCCDNIEESQNKSEVNKCNETITFTVENVIDDNQKSRNVFNIPEIDDIKFNPFATKTRICITPPPALELKDPSITHNDIEMTTEYKTKDQVNTTVCIEDGTKNEFKISSNTINTTSSSINTDKDATVREVNTEDEDTVEGPFFEAEESIDPDKVPDILEIEKDSTQFEDLPVTIHTDDIEEKGELFIDAEAFEFLLNQNKSNVVADSGKESLFLKFDPLFAKRVSSDGVLAALSSIQKRQSTPKKMTRAPNFPREEATVSTAGPSNMSSTPDQNNIEIAGTISKPMMVVNPAIAKQPVATPRISLTPKTNRQSLNFTSPAMVVIDRLLSLSGNTSLLDDNISTDAANVNHDANVVLVQMRELLAEKELYVHSLKSESKELKDRLNTLQTQVKSLENEGEERRKKVNDLNERLSEKTKINKSMAVVVEEYERTIASLIAEMEQEKKRNAEERIKLINERDEQTVHLTSMECSFSDLHSKYEKCKQIVVSMKANEEAYKKSFKEFDENYLKMQKNYDLLKQHATSKLNHANQELEKMNKSHEAEVLKMSAMIKRKELHITSLEESLAQKNKAIEELTAICDELINKVG